jgi:hypothetical protein
LKQRREMKKKKQKRSKKADDHALLLELTRKALLENIGAFTTIDSCPIEKHTLDANA